MSKIIILVLFLLTIIGIDYYCYAALNQVFKKSIWLKILYIFSTLLVLCTIIYVSSGFHVLRGGRAPWQNILFGLVFTFIISKILYAGMLLVVDMTRIVEWVGRKASSTPYAGDGQFFPDRRSFVSKSLAGLAALPFAAMIYGITKGKYAYKIEKLVLTLPHLPAVFDGFKILQLSDIHAGSFDSRDQVQKGILMALEEQADMIVFTGDLVNSEKDEIDHYADIFGQLKAPYGQYAIMGNHDYYGFHRMEDPVAKAKYEKAMHGKFDDIGFELLLNEHRYIEKDGERFCLAGVENWGAGPFSKKGDFNKAIEGADPDACTILLSHDPTHWDYEIIKHERPVDLTLSGHTHGMQFGINVPGYSWSPAKWSYPRWMGLYQADNQYLYVNRGFGFLGFPGRVGIMPEITVIELRSTIS